MTIKELRTRTGLSQQKFADRFHMKVDNVRCWEQGTSKPLDCVPWMVERILELEGEKDERLIRGSDAIFAMSNVRGRNVSIENIDFSFYYSPRNSSHGPRVKVVFDPFRMKIGEAGTQKLCDNWEFKQTSGSKISSKKILDMQSFFRKYLILFLLVWDFKSDEPDPEDYLTGRMTLKELIHNLQFYEEYSQELDSIHSVEELEYFCRINKLVNMYGN